jgi:hypothetical protein
MELFCFLIIFVVIIKLMKTLILSFSLGLALAVASCGPAAEDRAKMHSRAKTIADSIATVLKTSMDEAAKPGPYRPPVADTTKKAASDTTKKAK